jgi:hypothetical protein
MLLHVPGCISAPASAITMAPRKSMEDWVYLSRASKEVGDVGTPNSSTDLIVVAGTEDVDPQRAQDWGDSPPMLVPQRRRRILSPENKASARPESEGWEVLQQEDMQRQDIAIKMHTLTSAVVVHEVNCRHTVDEEQQIAYDELFNESLSNLYTLLQNRSCTLMQGMSARSPLLDDRGPSVLNCVNDEWELLNYRKIQVRDMYDDMLAAMCSIVMMIEERERQAIMHDQELCCDNLRQIGVCYKLQFLGQKQPTPHARVWRTPVRQKSLRNQPSVLFSRADKNLLHLEHMDRERRLAQNRRKMKAEEANRLWQVHTETQETVPSQKSAKRVRFVVASDSMALSSDPTTLRQSCL